MAEPRRKRATSNLRIALASLEDASELLGEDHPDHDTLDEILADVRYIVHRVEAREQT